MRALIARLAGIRSRVLRDAASDERCDHEDQTQSEHETSFRRERASFASLRAKDQGDAAARPHVNCLRRGLALAIAACRMHPAIPPHRPQRIAAPRFAKLLAEWRAGGRTSSAIVMGIVNVTPDSFSDGGLFFDAARRHRAWAKARRGGCGDPGHRRGVRPAAARKPVGEEEEKRRVLPVIEALASTGALISIDTMKAGVAEAALQAGAHILNDVRGLQGDPALAAVAARHRAGLIAMHNPGLLGSAKPLEGDPIAAVLAFFARSIAIARARRRDGGSARSRSRLRFREIRRAEPRAPGAVRRSSTPPAFRFLPGTSRKSFIGKITGRELRDRVIGSVVTNVAAALARRGDRSRP